jgi:actin-like ATPase involved in cell morphogenesis
MAYYLGIDLGTTFTAAATMHNGSVETQTLGSRTVAVPSVVFLRDDGAILVGEVAGRRAATDPGRVAREFKRRVGDPTPLILGGAPCRPEMLMARVLRWTVDTVAERLGEPPTAIALTHPANWGPFKLDLLTQAVHQVDLDAALLLPEPVAAATFYASERPLEPGVLVAVYDLGGGSFDTAVVRRVNEGFELVGTPDGIERLGGVDFDEAVLAHVREVTRGRLDALDPDETAARAAMLRLRQECTDAKEALSSDTRVTIPVLVPGFQADVRLNRSELEAMIRPAIAETIAALRRSLRSADLSPDDVSSVLLVGGSSRIPLVAEMVSADLGRPIAVDAHPKDAVAVGAALAVAARIPETSSPPSPPPAVPDALPVARPAPTAPDPIGPVDPTPAPPRPSRPVRRRSRPTRHRRSRLAPILLAVLGVAVATGLLTASAAASAAAGRATDGSDQARAATTLPLAVVGPDGLVASLQNERNFATAYVVGAEGVLSLPVSSFEDATQSTDTAIAALRQQVQAQGSEAAEAFGGPLDALATALPDLRALLPVNGLRTFANVEATSPLWTGYRPLIDDLLAAQDRLAPDIDDPDQRRAVTLLVLGQRRSEAMVDLVQQVDLLSTVGNPTPGFDTPAEISGIAAESGRIDRTGDALSSTGTGVYQPAVAALLADPGMAGFAEVMDEATSRGIADVSKVVPYSAGDSPAGAHALFREDVAAMMTGHVDEMEAAALERKQRLEGDAHRARIAAAVVLVALSGLALALYRTSGRRRPDPET